MKIWLKNWLSAKSALFIVLFLIIISPIIAYANIFSIFSNSAKNILQKSEQNSQNMALLQSHTSATGATGGGDISIVNNSALLPESSGSSTGDKDHANDHISVYLVRKGDTLAQIAKAFNVSVNTIIWTNDIKNGKVNPGDELIILPISGVQHTVKSGDTLQSIARIYKGDIEEIASYNDISVNAKLAIGDTIIIPDGEITAKKELTPTKSGSQNTSRNIRDYNKAPVYQGYYMRPVIGGIKTQGIHGYNGVDIASVFGADILASATGKVIIAKSSGWNGGYGAYIVIKHDNGTQTLYAHLSAVNVNVGDDVSQGQVIGQMGSSGKSTGTHLHFEIRGARNPF